MGHRYTSLASPWKRMGGKANLHRWIISRLPWHESYVEVFGGSAPVLLNKERPKDQEVYNDLDGLWHNSFAVARDHADELADLIYATPYSREEFLAAREMLSQWREGSVAVSPVELARLHMVVARQSFSAKGDSWSTSGFGGENRPRLWARLPEVLRNCMERLRGVHLEQRDYRYILNRYDHDRATFYIDPPYWGVEDEYYSVNQDDGFDHAALRDAVEDLKGSIVISYYEQNEVVKLYSGWRVARREVTVHAGDKKRRETEVLFIRASDFGHRRIRRPRMIFDRPVALP